MRTLRLPGFQAADRSGGNDEWLTPPYSEVALWMARLADHGSGTALVFARTDTAWWWDSVVQRAQLVRFVQGRIRFRTVDGAEAPAGAGAGSAFIAYGSDDAQRLAEAERLGGWVVPIRP